MLTRIFMLCFILAVTPIAHAQPLTGTPSHIRDGDTFLIGDQPVRLCGIDAPESRTKAGKKATAFITRKISGKTVSCIPVGEGTVCDGRSRRFNRDRIVAQCFVQNHDLAEMLVQSGHACDWSRFSGGYYHKTGGCSR